MKLLLPKKSVKTSVSKNAIRLYCPQLLVNGNFGLLPVFEEMRGPFMRKKN